MRGLACDRNGRQPAPTPCPTVFLAQWVDLRGKQINWEGIGTFKNVHEVPNPKAPEEDQPVAGESYHWFEARVEDLGEPGSHGSDDPEVCPPEGFNCSTIEEEDCLECADFYTITIYLGYDPETEQPNKTDVLYQIYGYLGGGNHQIHPPIPGDHNCHGGGN